LQQFTDHVHLSRCFHVALFQPIPPVCISKKECHRSRDVRPGSVQIRWRAVGYSVFRKDLPDPLRFHTDSWDLSVDLKTALAATVVIDARSRDAYIAGHIPGAVSFPHRDMNAARLDRSKVYVVYCDGIRCNASTKGA
jgi:hypothetical protein